MHNLRQTVFIGGLLKHSLIDFPGMIACVVFAQGCNFRCPYCHNPELVPQPHKAENPGVTVEELISFLKKRQGLLDGVVISGGEATLQPGLRALCSLVKSMGFRVKLDTNGSRPDILASLLEEELLDYVAMDIKTDSGGYGLFAGNGSGSVTESIRLIMAMAPSYEFRTTCVRPYVNRDRMPRIARMIQGAARYVLQPCSMRGPMLNPDVLDIPGDFLGTEEILELQQIAQPFVDHCCVR